MISVLEKGFKFIPTPTKVDDVEFKADVTTLSYKIKRHLNSYRFRHTHQNEGTDLLRPPANTAPGKVTNNQQNTICDVIAALKPVKLRHTHRNINKEEEIAIEALRSTPGIIIKPADKGSGVVLMNEIDYMTSIKTSLDDPDTFKKVHIDSNYLVKKVATFTNKWKQVLTKVETAAIIKTESYLATTYGLPKIHKSQLVKTATLAHLQHNNSSVIRMNYPEDLSFRPIISCTKCPTKKLCELLDHILRPFLIHVKYRLKDTWHFLRECPKQLDEDSYFVTADITSLYTNITTDRGSEAIGHFFDAYKNDTTLPPRITKEFTIALYEFLQNNLFFTHDGTVYQQWVGTGMGKDYSPAIADIKMGYDEIKLEGFIMTNFSREVCSLFLEWYKRYLDDIFFAWSKKYKHQLEKIKQFMQALDPKIKFTFEDSFNNSNNGIAFLDVWLQINDNGKVSSDIYAKPTDTFNYLPFTSSHPRHTIRNIPFVLARRIRGIVSNEEILDQRFREMKARLKAKKYPLGLINGAIIKAKSLNRDDIIITNHNKNKHQNNNALKEIHFITTFNGTTHNPTNRANSCVESLNALLPESKHMRLVNSMRRGANIADLCVFNSKAVKRVTKCLKGCIFCGYILEGSSVTLKNGITLKTNANMTCTSRNLIYIIIAGRCKEYYIGETGDQINKRFTVHRNQGKEGTMFVPCQADQHLRVCDGNNYKVFPFYRPQRNDFVLRRAIEEKYIKLLNPKLNGDLS